MKTQLDFFKHLRPAEPWRVRWQRFYWLSRAWATHCDPDTEVRAASVRCFHAAREVRRAWRDEKQLPPKTTLPRWYCEQRIAQGFRATTDDESLYRALSESHAGLE